MWLVTRNGTCRIRACARFRYPCHAMSSKLKCDCTAGEPPGQLSPPPWPLVYLCDRWTPRTTASSGPRLERRANLSSQRPTLTAATSDSMWVQLALSTVAPSPTARQQHTLAPEPLFVVGLSPLETSICIKWKYSRLLEMKDYQALFHVPYELKCDK